MTPDEADYIRELRGALLEARKASKEAMLERDAYRRRVEALVKPPVIKPVDTRVLSPADYARNKSDGVRTIMRAERERKESTMLPDLTGLDVRTMSKEDYRALKNKLLRRG